MINNRIAKRRCILFLGAGASEPLGIKTTEPFLQLIPLKYLQFLKNKGGDYENEANIAKFINPFFQIAAKRFGMKNPDIEMVLDYIDFLLKIGDESKEFPSEILRLSGIGSFLGWNKYFSELKEFLQQCVVEHYSSVDGESAYKLYSPLISFICSKEKTLPVFTTNYDWVFEHLVEFAEDDYKLIDGFKSLGGLGERWTRAVFDGYRSSPKKTNIVLIKLHGSTSWYRDKQGKIKRISEAAPRIGQSKALLIYPTQVKADAVQEDPFKTGYEYFKASLENAKFCVVIGYSFRDPVINKTFSVAIAKNVNLRLIIIDPSTSNSFQDGLMQKLSLDMSEFNSRVHCYKCKFGSPEAVNTIVSDYTSSSMLYH